MPSPFVPTSTSSFVPLEDQFSSVSLNPAPSHDLETAEEAFPVEKPESTPTAPPITSFGPPFAPPSDNVFFNPAQTSSSFQSQPQMMSTPNYSEGFNQGQHNDHPVAPIYAQSLPPKQPDIIPPPQKLSQTATTEAKGPIPAEHEELPRVLEELRSACHSAAAQPQMKRKLEDVARKLEIFSDKLREGSFSAKTLASLHKMVEAMQKKDYQLALSIHTQLVTSGNFSEISSFLPAVKVLIQSAAQLGVYL